MFIFLPEHISLHMCTFKCRISQSYLNASDAVFLLPIAQKYSLGPYNLHLANILGRCDALVWSHWTVMILHPANMHYTSIESGKHYLSGSHTCRKSNSDWEWGGCPPFYCNAVCKLFSSVLQTVVENCNGSSCTTW